MLYIDPEKTKDEQGEQHTGLRGTELESLDLEAARQLIVQLQASLEARERQLERKMVEVANMQDAMQQVMVKPTAMCCFASKPSVLIQ